MRVLWTLLKIVLVLVLAIPVSIIVLGTALGILGALVGIAILALKLAIIGLVGWGAFRLMRRLVGGPSRAERRNTVTELPPPPVDPHYEAALRELDRELGEVRR
jgi:ABC-type transport system involved in cytochrome c biogenesis permease subunit